MNYKFMATLSFVIGFSLTSQAQELKLKKALEQSVERFDRIKSKQLLVLASEQNTAFQKQLHLPDFTLSAQQSFGTINMIHGSMYGLGGLASASTSMSLAEQNWNAAFGSLYFANVNWNLYTFGKIKNQVTFGEKKEKTAQADLDQEIFQHQVKVSAAYLNLLASQRLKYVQQKNTERAQVFFEMTASRAKSGLIPEVDAQLAKAEVSNAQSQYLKSYDKELEFGKQLAILLDDEFQTYQLDSLYSSSLPKHDPKNEDQTRDLHPILQLQQRKIEEGQQQEEILKANKRPTLSAFGLLQGRGSGFNWNYAQDRSAYSSSYLKGVGIDRSNYLLGVSLTWNLTSIPRANTKIKEQQFQTQALQHGFEQFNKELQVQKSMATALLDNAKKNFEETKVQKSAALQAYKQHTALYENGLTTLVDYTQALYSLNRAEIDYELAQNNVWQSLLALAAAQGDLTVFIPQP